MSKGFNLYQFNRAEHKTVDRRWFTAFFFDIMMK